MTQTPAPGSRPLRRRLSRRLAATGLSLLLLSAPLSAAAAVPTPSTPAPSASASPESAAGTLTATVAPSANGLHRTGEPFSVTVVIDNAAGEDTPPGRVTISLGETALADRSTLDAWLAGDRQARATTELGAVDVPAIPNGDSAAPLVVVPADHPALAGRAPGVYPLLAVVSAGGRESVATSVMIVPRADAPPSPVGLVVPITGPPSARGLLSSDDLAELTAPDGELTAQLDAAATAPVILAVDPAIPAAIRVLGTSAPASATAWLERLGQLPNSRFALQFGDADAAAQIAAGLPAPLQPASLQSYMSASNFSSAPADPGATPTTPATATPSPTPGGVVLPSLEELLSVGASRAPVFWPPSGTAGPETVAALGALGTPEARALTLVASGSTSAGATGATVPARVDAGGSAALVYDSIISGALAAAAGQAAAPRRTASLSIATAHLTLATAEAGGRPLLVTLDRPSTLSAGSLRAAVAAVAQTPGASLIPLEQLADAPPSNAAVQPVPVDEPRLAAIRALAEDEGRLGRFATILDDPSVLSGPERAEILQLMGSAWRADPDAAVAAQAAHRTETGETLDAVGILPSIGVNLIAYSASLPPTVRNDLPWPVNLELVAQPDDPRLVIQDRTSVRVQADSNTSVPIPVQSRLANGEVTVTLQLFSPAGEPIGAVQSVDVDVHADWESIGLVVFVILLVLFIGTGVVRMVLRRRAARRESIEEAAA